MAAGTEAWMQSRRVGWRDMNQSMITKHGPTMVRALDDALCSASRHGDDVDVYHLMRCETGEMITRFFFGPTTPTSHAQPTSGPRSLSASWAAT
jgi:hypothetical protein